MVLAGSQEITMPAEANEASFQAATEKPTLDRLINPGAGIRVPVELHAPATKERITVWLPTEVEEVDDELLEQMRNLMRCQRTGRTHQIDARLVAALGQVAQHYPGKEIEVISGYRVGHGAKNSKHFHGRAIDFRVVGVPAHVLRDHLWNAFEDQVGVGSYRGRSFVHLDIRPGEAKIGWDQRRVGSRYRYNPWWTAERRTSGS